MTSNEQLARALQPELERAGWTLSLGAITAVLEALDFRRATETAAPRMLRDGWFRLGPDGQWHPVERFMLAGDEDEARTVQTCFPGQSVEFRGETEGAPYVEPVPCPKCSAFVKANGGPSQVFHSDGPCPPYLTEKTSGEPTR